LFIQKTFLIIISIALVLYAFFMFNEKLLPQVSVSKPIHIEPIIIPPSVKEDSDDEILEKLKLVTKEIFKNAQPSEDEIAQEVLLTLKALLKSKKEEDNKQKDIDKKRELAKIKLLKEKEFIRKKEELRKKEYARELDRKKKLEEKKRLASKKDLEEKIILFIAPKINHEKEKTIKESIILGEQQDIYTLSKEEEKKFHNLEIVSESETFILEEKTKIKNPIANKESEIEVNLDDLPLVETLGVINVSKPFLKNQE